MSVVPVYSANTDSLEVSWFVPICSDDYRYLGDQDSDFRSSWEDTSEIQQTADKLDYRNIACPSSYHVGQDTLSSGAANAPSIENITSPPQYDVQKRNQSLSCSLSLANKKYCKNAI